MTTTRSQFFAPRGAEVANNRWSWCAVNNNEKVVYFGIFQGRSTSAGGLILSEDWEMRRGRRQPGYSDALQKLKLVEADGYKLAVFTMIPRKIGDDVSGPSEIERILNDVRMSRLCKIGKDWFAFFVDGSDDMAEALSDTVPPLYPEGAKKRVTVNAVERNAKARAKCIEHFGPKCQACGLNFADAYGTLGEGFIHVHHINLISLASEGYSVDPTEDLVPLCPNCHAMVHRTNPPIPVENLRQLISEMAAK